jgi:hypothetical protein
MALDRRSFLQSSLALGVSAGAGAFLPQRLFAIAANSRISVLDFGADPTGEKDATQAVRKAIASLAPNSARLVFPAGKYRFAASNETAMQFTSFNGIEIYANNAELRFSGNTAPFGFRSSKDIAVHDMHVEWDHPAFTTSRTTGCFVLEGCQGVLFEDVSVRRTPSTAFLVRGCRDLNMEGVSVAGDASSAQHQLAAGGDAVHCVDCHGNVVLKDVRFDGIGGDAINIYQSYWKIAYRLDDRTVVIAADGPRLHEKWDLPQPGDFVQFSSSSTLQLLGEIGISTVEPAASRHGSGTKLTFPETLSPLIVPGTLVCSVVDAPRVSLDHAKIANTVGRGLVLHTRGEITNNHFQGCAQEAILLAPDGRSLQGPAVQNIRISGNTFEDCNNGVASASGRRGIISVDTSQERGNNAADKAAASEPPPVALNSGVRIQGNTFVRSTGVAIYASGLDYLVVHENILGHSASPHSGQAPVAIELHNVADAELSNNISEVPQTIALNHCADSVATQDNRLLTTAKLG